MSQTGYPPAVLSASTSEMVSGTARDHDADGGLTPVHGPPPPVRRCPVPNYTQGVCLGLWLFSVQLQRKNCNLQLFATQFDTRVAVWNAVRFTDLYCTLCQLPSSGLMHGRRRLASRLNRLVVA